MARQKLTHSAATGSEAQVAILASILASAFLRVRSAQSSKLPSDPEDTGLSNDAEQSGYGADQTKDLLP